MPKLKAKGLKLKANASAIAEAYSFLSLYRLDVRVGSKKVCFALSFRL